MRPVPNGTALHRCTRSCRAARRVAASRRRAEALCYLRYDLNAVPPRHRSLVLQEADLRPGGTGRRSTVRFSSPFEASIVPIPSRGRSPDEAPRCCLLSSHAGRSIVKFGCRRNACCKVNEWQKPESGRLAMNDRNWVMPVVCPRPARSTEPTFDQRLPSPRRPGISNAPHCRHTSVTACPIRSIIIWRSTAVHISSSERPPSNIAVIDANGWKGSL